MSDLTPATDDVRRRFAQALGAPFSEIFAEQFDRWLAAYEAEVRRQAFDEAREQEWGLVVESSSPGSYEGSCIALHYRGQRWIREDLVLTAHKDGVA